MSPSQQIFLSVERGRGPDAVPAIVKLNALAWLGEREAGEALKVLKRKPPENTLQDLVALRRALPPWMSKSISRSLLTHG